MKLALISILSGLIIGIIVGPLLIPLLRRLKFGQRVRTDGPKSHLKKAGTPTMGGIIFLVAMVLTVVFWSRLTDEVLLVVAITLGFGLIGLADDLIKVVFKRPLGLKARQKLLGQVLLSLILTYVAVHFLGRGTDVIVPLTDIEWQMGIFYYLFAVLVVVGTTNAVNLTDGLDGLATGSTFLVFLGYMIICLLAVDTPPIASVNYQDLAVFAGAMAGGCLAFLFFNRYPARVFMGDTGSLALGGAIASLALITKTELILPLLGGVYVLEALSVMLQVISFRLTGKRIFRMSPLHHHFELLGWHETKVVLSFWGVSALFVVLGLVVVTL